MQLEIQQRIEAIRKHLRHLQESIDHAQKRLMDLYLKMDSQASLPENRKALIDELSATEREMAQVASKLEDIERKSNDLYLSPGATNETTEQMLERMQQKAQLGDKENALLEKVKEAETAVGMMLKKMKEVTNEVQKGSASQELAALKAKMGLGKKKLGE